MNEITRIGFIGIGNMGAPMAANLRRAGYRVTVFDIDPARARAFAREHDAQATAELAALGDASDVVITMLPTGREVRQALFELAGGALAAHLRPGAIVIDMSSADPVGTRALGGELAANGIALVDAPVSGGVPRATNGTLALMIGGDAATVASVKPILERMGDRLFEVGGLGCGHAMKALNNFLAATSFAAASEAVSVGRKFGLDPAVMTDVLNVSTGRSFATEALIKQHVLSGTFATGFALGLLAKDVKIAADLAEQIEIDAPIGGLVRDLFADARDELGFAQDHTRAASFWERRANGSG